MSNERAGTWIVNTGERPLELLVKGPKLITLQSNVPKFFSDVHEAINIINRYSTVHACDNPEKFLQGRKFRKLVIRDAGIGDLLLLEPVLRAQLLKTENKEEITVLSTFPCVFQNHPDIKSIRALSKSDDKEGKINYYDEEIDMRDYSETSPTRAKKHRTDVYNEKFKSFVIESDKEPRLYFTGKEGKELQKKDGYTYIGVSVDASHRYRRMNNKKEFVERLLELNEKYIVVLLGSANGEKIKDDRVLNLECKTTVEQVFKIISELDYMIAVDSGLMHVALTLHVPTVCMFSIITPDLRLRYYTGQYQVYTVENLKCIGCGDFHMERCRNEGLSPENTPSPARCTIASADVVNELLNKMEKCEPRILIKTQEKAKIQAPAIIKNRGSAKLKMPIIVLNEEKNLPRFIDLVINHPAIGEVIAIDGGSDDRTVELLEMAGAKVYVHAYDKNYHDMQALQRNISCSFVKDNEKIIIMDIDECFSKELSDHLFELAESDIEYGIISRRTFKYFDDIKFPNKQIKDYPDYQPRFYSWNRKFKFVGSPHHHTLNVPEPVKINYDIIHFECEGKDRQKLEETWAIMHAATKVYYT